MAERIVCCRNSGIRDLRSLDMAIMLSEAAAKGIKHIIKEQGLPQEQPRLRVGVKGGGSSGFSYMLDLTEGAKREAVEEMEGHGGKILCAIKHTLSLN